MGNITRGMSVIGCLAEKGSCSASEIAKELGLKRSTVFRILSEMTRIEWVLKDQKTRKYVPGNRAQLIGFKIASHLALQSVSLPHLHTLSEISGETVLLSERVGLQRTVTFQVESKHETRTILRKGELRDLWYGCASMAILAFMDEQEIETVLSRTFSESPTLRTPTGQVVNIDDLRRELAGIRKQGYAVSFGTLVPDVAGVAAPILSVGKRAIGSITICGPGYRFTANRAIGYGPLVSETARQISAQMGDKESL